MGISGVATEWAANWQLAILIVSNHRPCFLKQSNFRNFLCQTLKISKVSLVVMGT
jgi:hypothetical protein